MPYPAINERRMPYDIDGTEVGYRTTGGFTGVPTAWCDSTKKQQLNGYQREGTGIGTDWSATAAIWLFFPELREVTGIAMLWIIPGGSTIPPTGFSIQGSADTTNGIDGTWNAGSLTPGWSYQNDDDEWRTTIFAVSFPSAVKAVRFSFSTGIGSNSYIRNFHIYGRKAAGETPDDLLMCDAAGTELTALKDWGDQPEGTTETWTFRVKNSSATKTANNINLQLNHPEFALAWDAGGPWQSVLDIASLAPGATSNLIYVRNLIGPPLQTLGPRFARVIATVGSWT